MKHRLNPYQAAPEAMKASAVLDTYIQAEISSPALSS